MNTRRSLTRRELLRAGAAVGGGLALAACAPGTSPSGTGASPGAAPAALTQEALVAAAQKEGGQVLWYLPGSTDMAAALKAGFEKAYPWAKLTTFSASLRDLPNKILTESVTGAPTADVFMLPATFRQMLLQNDVPAKAKIRADAAMPQDLVDAEEYAHPCYILLVTTLYNTNLLKEPPKDPFELGSAAWKDKITFDRVQSLGQSTLWLAAWRKQWGDSKWVGWLNSLASNNVFITQSAGDSYAAILRGERVIGIGSSNDVLAQPAGTPVAANYSYPPVRFIQYLWLTKRAAHPAAGQLFIEWTCSEEGQKAIGSTGRSPARDLDIPVAVKRILPAGITPVPGTDLSDFYARTDNYTNFMNQLWRG